MPADRVGRAGWAGQRHLVLASAQIVRETCDLLGLRGKFVDSAEGSHWPRGVHTGLVAVEAAPEAYLGYKAGTDQLLAPKGGCHSADSGSAMAAMKVVNCSSDQEFPLAVQVLEPP